MDNKMNFSRAFIVTHITISSARWVWGETKFTWIRFYRLFSCRVFFGFEDLRWSFFQARDVWREPEKKNWSSNSYQYDIVKWDFYDCKSCHNTPLAGLIHFRSFSSDGRREVSFTTIHNGLALRHHSLTWWRHPKTFLSLEVEINYLHRRWS